MPSRPYHLLSKRSKRRFLKQSVRLAFKESNVDKCIPSTISPILSNSSQSDQSESSFELEFNKDQDQEYQDPEEKPENQSASDIIIYTSSSEEYFSESEDFSKKHENVNAILEKVQSWSINNNVTRSATSELLQILKGHECFGTFPSDSRTVLCTPRFTKKVYNWKGRILLFRDI